MRAHTRGFRPGGKKFLSLSFRSESDVDDRRLGFRTCLGQTYILHKKALRRLVTGIRSIERLLTDERRFRSNGTSQAQTQYNRDLKKSDVIGGGVQNISKDKMIPMQEWNVRLDAVRVAAWARVNITKRAGEMDLSLLSLPTKVIFSRWTKGPPLAIQIFFGQMAGPTRRPPRHKWAYNSTHRGYTVTPVAHVQGARITGSGAHLVPSTPKL